MYKVLDVHFQNTPKTIGCTLIQAPNGENIIIDPGPHSCFPVLEKELSSLGLHLSDISKVLLTHIHLDHSGGTWALAEAGADIYLHPLAAEHMENPEKLLASATRIYQDKMREYWGDVRSISAAKIQTLSDGQKIDLGDGNQLEVLYTPGHTRHHISFWLGKTFFAGDALGVKIAEGGVVPPCPPPDLEVDVWLNTLEKLKQNMPETIVLTHFAESSLSSEEHILAMQTGLSASFGKVVESHKLEESHETRLQMLENLYEKLAKTKEAYPVINPPYMSLSGFERYMKLRSIS